MWPLEPTFISANHVVYVFNVMKEKLCAGQLNAYTTLKIIKVKPT